MNLAGVDAECHLQNWKCRCRMLFTNLASVHVQIQL